MEISTLLGPDYLKRFKVFHQITLFPPVWEALLVGRCPLCNNKLIASRSRPQHLCKTVKHKKTFIIANDTYEKILSSNLPRAPVEIREKILSKLNQIQLCTKNQSIPALSSHFRDTRN